jgi:hypothetical protein
MVYRRCLAQDVAARSSLGTVIQQADIQERRLHVEKRIAAFRAIQAAYMPEAICYLTAHPPDEQSESPPETQSLFFPSQLPPSVTASNSRVVDMERQLRYAQATDAIVELRQSLIVRAHLSKYKADQVRGQHANTRARTLLNKAEARTEAIASRYRVARACYQALAGSGEWENVLKPLRLQDIRTLSSHEDDIERTRRDGPGEGHRMLSWIWVTTGSVESDAPDMHEGKLTQFSSMWHLLTVQ